MAGISLSDALGNTERVRGLRWENGNQVIPGIEKPVGQQTTDAPGLSGGVSRWLLLQS